MVRSKILLGARRLTIRPKGFSRIRFLCIGAIENESSAAFSAKRRRGKTTAAVRALIDAMGFESRGGC
jgi:hypothetical protein